MQCANKIYLKGEKCQLPNIIQTTSQIFIHIQIKRLN